MVRNNQYNQWFLLFNSHQYINIRSSAIHNWPNIEILKYHAIYRYQWLIVVLLTQRTRKRDSFKDLWRLLAQYTVRIKALYLPFNKADIQKTRRRYYRSNWVSWILLSYDTVYYWSMILYIIEFKIKICVRIVTTFNLFKYTGLGIYHPFLSDFVVFVKLY